MQMNKVLLGCSHAHSFTHLYGGLHTTVAELWTCSKDCLWMVLILLCSNLQTSGMWPSCHCFKCQAYHFTEMLLYFIHQHNNHHVKTNQTEPKKEQNSGIQNVMLLSHSGVWIILLKNWTGKHCLCCIVTLQLC